MAENVAHRQALGEVREAKARTVFAAVRSHGPVVVGDLVQLTRMSRPTVVNHLRDLQARGFITERSEPGEGSGRPPSTYRVAEDRFVLALDMLDESMALALGTLDGRVVHATTATLPRFGTAEARFQRAMDAVRALLEEDDLCLEQIVGAGIAHTGTVSEAGVLTRATLVPMWTGFPLLDRFQMALDCPVVVINDLKAAAYGEFVSRDCLPGSLLYVKADPGINLSLVTQGQPFTGATGSAGEIGDLTRSDQLSDDEWFDRVGYSVALALAVTDPELVVMSAPAATRDALAVEIQRHWQLSKVTAHVPRTEDAVLGAAGAVVGALILGTANTLELALGGDDAPSAMVTGVDELRELLGERGHAVTVPGREARAEVHDLPVAVIGDPGALQEAMDVECARQGVRLVGQAADQAAAAFVFAPSAEHAELCLPLLQRGVAVCLQPPLADDLASASRLLETASDSGASLFVARPPRVGPSLQTLSDLLGRQDIGAVRAVWVDHFGAGSPATDPLRRAASLIEEMAELVQSHPTAVQVCDFGGRELAATVELASGCTVSLRQSTAAVEGSLVTVLTERARLVQRSSADQAQVWVQRAGRPEEAHEVPEVVDTFDGDRAMVGAFLELMRHGNQLEGDPVVAWRGVALREAVARSLVEGGRVPVAGTMDCNQ